MPFLAVSAGVQAGAIVAIDEMRPVPDPFLLLELTGEGSGRILSQPAGIACGDDCRNSFGAGTEIRLIAIKGENSTFKGWGDACEMDPDNPLECTFVLEETTRVSIEFGLIPEEVEVAFQEWDKPNIGETAVEDDEAVVVLPIPDPEIEAEMLEMPLEPLLEPPPPEPEPEIAALPEPPPVPEPPAEEPPPPMPEMEAYMVEVDDDENIVEEAPDDATKLSDENRDVAEETHATETNLEKELKGEEIASAESDLDMEDIGAEEQEIAQTEDVEETSLDAERSEEISKAGDNEEITAVKSGDEGEGGDDGDDGDDSESPDRGALAMRDIDGRGAVYLDEKETGGKSGKSGKEGDAGIKTQLDMDDYEAIVGEDVAQKERELAKKTQSKRQGRWEKKLGAIKSSLENFTPDVKPGNQTALKTRKAPFAVYIARMHRRIHELWGFGFLEDLDEKSSTHALNDWDLETTIEVVVNPDGTIHKTTIVKHSGQLPFDVAALDVIHSAGPYEETPKEIRSPNDKIYLRWTFNRNWRQCGTFNVQPFILSEAPDEDVDELNDGDILANVPKIGDDDHAGHEHADEDSAADNARAQVNMPAPDDPKAKHTANLWVTGFTKKDVSKMVKVTSTPFTSGDIIVANNRAELTAIYNIVLDETASFKEFVIVSGAQYRKKFGALPPGIDVTTDELFMVVESVKKERFTLVMKPDAAGEYKIIALHR